MKRQVSGSLYFYHNDRITSIKQGDDFRSVVRSPEFALAEQRNENAGALGPMACDRAGSVLRVGNESLLKNYAPYGYSPGTPGAMDIAGFQGEHFDSASNLYVLQSRVCSPSLGRFASPDSMAPFDVDDFNYYASFRNDPINRRDPSGHFSVFDMFRSKATIMQRKAVKLHKMQTYIINIGKLMAETASSSTAGEASSLQENLQKHYEKLIARGDKKENWIKKYENTPLYTTNMMNTTTLKDNVFTPSEIVENYNASKEWVSEYPEKLKTRQKQPAYRPDESDKSGFRIGGKTHKQKLNEQRNKNEAVRRS